MKVMKRIFGVLLAVAMTFGVSVTAFAAGDGSITVANPLEGQVYTAYKIFDVTYNEGQTSYSYSISGDSEWFGVVQGYDGVTLTKATVGNVYVVTMKEDFSAASFANVLKQAVDGKTGTILADGGDTAFADNLELGYYFVSSTTGALCNLTTTKPDATIHDKNDVPFEKTDDQEDVEIGKTVNYTITGKIPDATGFQTYLYKITDTMSEGLTFQKDVAVTVGGDVLETDKYVLEQTEDGFTLNIKVLELQNKVGEEIKVTYTAVVNDNAVSVVSRNNAKLEYSNDPSDDSQTSTITEEETVFSAKIMIDKFEEGKEGKKLSDAKFVLKNADDDSAEYYKYTAARDGVPAKVEWVSDKEDATEVTTDDQGSAGFNGLKNGTYYLEETAAPDGYNMLTETVEVVIEGSDAQPEMLTISAKVANNTGLTFPETGGMGTKIFYVLGGVLVVGATVLLVTKKRMDTGR